MSSPLDLHRPEARADSVEDLVAFALRGEVRIPVFQRSLKWESQDVLDLFDSMLRGYPIGSLLLRRGRGQAGPLHLGPLHLVGKETMNALWVIDGQQRLTSMAAGLGRPDPQPTTPVDPFVVYFDAKERSFHAPPRTGGIPSHWVPVPRLLDSAKLSEWIFAWPHGKEPALRAAVFEAGRRLREYRVPSYIINTDDEDTLRLIFHRVNSSGKRLEWKDVHDALFGHKGKEPSSLTELSDELATLGRGRPDEQQLLQSLVGMRGLDVTRSFGEHVQQHPESLVGAAQQAAPVLRRVISFLSENAKIPHLRLLPYATPLPVLARFFLLHPEPCERSQMLLVRWVWRSILAPLGDERTLLRHAIAAIDTDEEGSLQRLLALVGKNYTLNGTAVYLDQRFDARTAHSRIAMLTLASLGPHTLPSLLQPAAPIDIAAWIEEADLDAFRQLTSRAGEGAANRILLPGKGTALPEIIEAISAFGLEHPALASHAISRECAEALARDDLDAALRLRAERIEMQIWLFTAPLAAWQANDRPSLDYVLSRMGGE